MKTFTITFIFILILNSQLYSQIGINTTNPKTLLHIDAASSVATTNPPTGTISVTQASDDVVIDNQGNVGIGTATPDTKLDIQSSSVGAIRISDTSEGVNKMLLSDANGVGTWASVAGSWFAVLNGRWTPTYYTSYTMRQVTGFSTQMISNPAQGGVNATSGTIQVPFSGKYRITISGHWGTNRVGNNPYNIVPAVYRNGIIAWTGNCIGYSNNWGLTPTFITILDLSQNDIVTMYTDETGTSNANNIDDCTFVCEFLQ
ncbi:hypothetical protein [Dysgonomonas macrotermitis]|uniref:C1q domain-containing protein n=1 Tax=Dysgonomonas macrotermitis TaxID=1346286 RepID=A0A1M4X1G4_9BACT|nr:hypothetical protein [Dysgonomonas macrotermitis]SHE87042.1 hypothetical protein SAMN05444362_102370 [Dysgonomonas macrotermitis]